MAQNCKFQAYYPLVKVRRAVDEQRLRFIPREKNRNTLKKLGLLIDDVANSVRELRANQFRETSFKAGKPPADVYVKTIHGEQVYIKFYLENDLVLISFHT